MDTDYNGWSNRETWATNLWLENDRGLYYTVQEMMQEAILSKEEDEYACSTCLAENLEALFDESFSDIEEMSQTGLNMLRDIGSLYRVNWYEIAESKLSELKTQEEANA